MGYFAPYIDDTGLHIPSYNDIRDDLIDRFKAIYGKDIYLDNDSQDYQMVSSFALKTYDTMQLLQIVYNNRSPKTAVGSGLDGIVKINGIKRKAASYSTCVLTLTGIAGTVIRNGVVKDDAEVKWNLPDIVTLMGASYQISAICTEIGAIEAGPGTITKIVTPTKGWIGVSNEVPAIAGKPVETPAALRQRQTISVANPSQALLDGTIGGIASVAGVTRYKVYENDTNQTDDNGVPGHSIAAVIEGGLDAEVAEQIYFRKGPGSGTYGDVRIEYINLDGQPTIIRFFRPVYVPINVIITVQKKSGYVFDMKTQIEEKIKEYLKELKIGNSVTTIGVLAAITPLITDLSKPVFAISGLTVGRQGGDMGITDVVITFKEVAQIGTIVITEV